MGDESGVTVAISTQRLATGLLLTKKLMKRANEIAVFEQFWI
jgi:hypothetical protein